jgi:hypothetical protein
MLTYIKRVAKSYGIPLSRFHILSVQLGNKQGKAWFKRMYKQIKLPQDKRRRKLVLGLTQSIGNHHPLLADLSAKKITCTLGKVEKTIVMCTEEVVKK